MCTLCFLSEMGFDSKTVHWHEAVRDLLHFLVHYLPSEITDELPIYVPRIPCRQYQARYCQGFKSRKLVMVGHSFGGGVSWVALLFQFFFC